MKVALLVPGGVDRDGVTRVIPCVLWLIEQRVRAGDEVHVFAFRQEERPAKWALLGAQVHNAGVRWSRARLFAALHSEHRRGRFDIVHAWWAEPAGVVAAVARLVLRIPVVLTLPGGDTAWIADIGFGLMGSRLGRLRLSIATRGADVITAPSVMIQHQAARLGIDAQLVPQGVSVEAWPPRPPQPRQAGAPLRLLHVASLNRVKDQSMLLEAVAILARQGLDFVLDVIGEDTLSGAVQRRAVALGLAEQVRFRGFLPQSELKGWMAQADIAVMSSRHEAGPIVLLEAALSGVPTVGTAVGRIADFAPEAALAVPVGDAAALANAILALAEDEGARLRIAAAAQARAIAEDVHFTGTRFGEIYTRLSAARSA